MIPQRSKVHESEISRPPEALKRVFLMSNTFERGGSERQFVALAQSLNRSEFYVDIGCIGARGEFLADVGPVKEFPVGGNLYGIGAWRARFRLARYLRVRRIEIAHAFDFYTNLLLIPAARMARVPVVIGSQRQLGDLLRPTRSRAQRLVLRYCDAVVCNSRSAADGLVSKGIPERKIALIQNGLPPANFVPTTPAFKRESGTLRVGMIARMNTEAKDHRAFLRAAVQVCKNHIGVEFVLVGDGPLRRELEEYAACLGIRRKTRFLGDREDIPAVLASLDLTVLPSKSESLSNAVIESMAAGVPVIASDVGGNHELLAEGRGVLVPTGDEEALAREIERVLAENELRDDMGRKSKRFVERSFTLKEMQERHEDLYKDLLARKVKRAQGIVLPSERVEHSGRLRVAIVAPSLRYVGGQSVQADLLLENFKHDRAVDARMIAIDPQFPQGLRWAEKIPFLRTVIREPLYLAKLWEGLKGTDAAHIFSASYWSFLLAPAPAIFVAYLRGAKTLVHYHSGEALDHLSRFPAARWILRRVDKLVVPSRFLAGIMSRFGLQSEVVPNTVDLAQFSFRDRTPLHPHMVCTRGFHPYYCVDQVVQAFSEVKRVFPEACLDLVGSGPLESEIRSLVTELGLKGVHFHGVASRSDIARYYERADIFINASRLDNMPVSILEAFASGTPVVSTAPEGMEFLVEHDRTGLLCAPGDVKALARNVISLLQDAGLSSRLAQNAQEECRRYSWKTVREQWVDLYESMARPICERQLSIEGS